MLSRTVENIDGWTVTDLPVAYTETDYDRARTELIAQCKNTPELAALFEYGYIPALGISDMDFWAVYPDDVERMYIANAPVLSEKSRHVMVHHATVITEKHYKKMLYFDPWTTIRWPNGHRLLYQRPDIKRNLNFEALTFSPTDFDILGMVYVEEFLMGALTLVPAYARRELPVRTIFENLKSCVYIIEEVNKIATGTLIDPTFPDEFRALRSQWFELDQETAVRTLIPLFQRGLLAAFEISFFLGKWFTDRATMESAASLGLRRPIHSPVSGITVYLNTFLEKCVFTDSLASASSAFERSVGACKTETVRIGWRTKKVSYTVLFLPLGLAAMRLGFLAERGILSDALREDFFTAADRVPVFKPSVFMEKVRMINEITETYNRTQMPGMNGKGWLFGNNRFGYAFGKDKLRRKVLAYLVRRRFWSLIAETC
jgi:hypothetical protein